MIGRLVHVATQSGLTSVRVLLVIAEFLWALTLYWPGDTFGRPTYNGMAAVASEIEWANVFLASGTLQLWILYRADYHGKFASLFAAWNSVLWLFVCISMYLSVYPPPSAISGEFSLTLGALWVFFRTNPREEKPNE